MGINPLRRDNIMQNMALEANALVHERKRGGQANKGQKADSVQEELSFSCC